MRLLPGSIPRIKTDPNACVKDIRFRPLFRGGKVLDGQCSGRGLQNGSVSGLGTEKIAVIRFLGRLERVNEVGAGKIIEGRCTWKSAGMAMGAVD